MAQKGHSGPLRPLWPMGPLGPFWPKFNETKGGQGDNTQAPKSKWAHMCTFWPLISSIPKWPERTPGPKLAKNHILETFNEWALVTTRGHQLRSRKASPQLKGRPLLHQCILYQRIQA
ncbi:hypothetical protein O181_021178 [Austropuccinia psidii MF-1]|uniref:Uncharacterized protein n=1 Tax=Austropuccinia psidii MF-1 TaxID=1389203 RepID=A0A9Q3GV72_9BASI|nr:hypothetical protein [Austropuccinia psidii MF-1]